MKIKNLKLKNRFLLAPMLEPNDIAFRLLSKKAGCALTYTGMINPLSKQKLILTDKPAIQIFCNSPRGIKSFIKKYDKKVSLWDFNLGCPSKLSKKLKHGVFMHEDIEVIREILEVMHSATKKPITIKLRKSPNALKIAKLAERYVDAISIHPRNAKQGYSGKPDLIFAKRLKKASKIPIIYSGDVTEKNAPALLKNFDFLMVGRSAIGDPNIFSRLLNRKQKISFANYLKLAEKYKLFFRQIKMQAMNFTKGMKNAKKLRAKLISAKTIEDIKRQFSIS